MQPLHTPIPSGLASGGTFSFVQCVNTSTGMCAGTASHQGTAEESALPCQTWENLQTTQGIPFSEMASAEASRNEQTKTASIDPDSSLDLDLITDNKPFDRFSLHPIAEIELPLDSVELRCPGHIDTHHLIQLESCRPSHSSPIPIHLAASHIVMPLLPHRWEEMLCQHPDQSLAAYTLYLVCQTASTSDTRLTGGVDGQCQ